jgi:hypothetical protein
MLAASAPAFADHIRVVSDITVTPAERVEQGYNLSLRLRTTDGRPFNEASVRLYEVVELFGRREMYITTVVTDGQGSAMTTYLPARSGRHELIARAPGREHYPDVEATFSFDATVAAPSYREPVVPLASFSAAVPYGVGVVVLSVWALIAFALFGSAIGIRRNKRDRHPIA